MHNLNNAIMQYLTIQLTQYLTMQLYATNTEQHNAITCKTCTIAKPVQFNNVVQRVNNTIIYNSPQTYISV